MIVCVLHGTPFYDRLLTAWGVHPFQFPFLDADTVMSALRCRRLGVDVFDTNPCDALGRVYDYSPLWLHFSILPFTPGWIAPVGFAILTAFTLALLLLPPGRDWRAASIISFGTLGTSVVFALERANNDVIIFVLVAIGANFATRSLGGRAFGYAALMLAGLLKYYPLVTMALAVRERPRVFVAVALVAALVLTVFVVGEAGPLRRALELIPTGSFYGDMFGARTLPFGLAYMAGESPALGRLGELGLDLTSIVLAARLSAHPAMMDDLRQLTLPERAFLLAGALLVLSCFLTAQNNGYRALHLVLVLPAFTALARRRAWSVVVAVTLLLLWAEGWRHWLDALIDHVPPWEEGALYLQAIPDRPRAMAWLFREACWWSIVTILWATTFALLRESATIRALRRAA